MSCRQIFKDYYTPTVASSYILEVIKKSTKAHCSKMDSHNYNTQRKLDLHVHICNTVLFRKSVTNMGIRLYKVPDYIKTLDNFISFKRELKSLSILINADIMPVYYNVLYFIVVGLLLVFRVWIWIVNCIFLSLGMDCTLSSTRPMSHM